jgi:hypothetical protein
MSGGGWTVAETAVVRPPPTRRTLSRQSSTGSQSEQTSSSLKRRKGARLSGEHHVRWSDRSQSEEELDKLLDGLEELTVTLPQVNFNSPQSFPEASSPKVSPTKASAASTEFPTRNIRSEAGAARPGPPPPPPTSTLPKRCQGDGEEQKPEKLGDPLDHLASDRHLVVTGASQAPRVGGGRAGETLTELDGRRSHFNATNDWLTKEALQREKPLPFTSKTSSEPRDRPYHTLKGSKPFSYIHQGEMANAGKLTGSGVGMLRQAGLESPGLLRKIMASDDRLDLSDVDRPESPPKFTSTPKISQENNTNRLKDELMKENRAGATSVGRSYQQPLNAASSNMSEASRKGERTIKIERSQALHFPEAFEQRREPETFTQRPSPYASDHLNDVEASLTWLERQQQKLRERRELERKRSGLRAQHLESDLKSSLALAAINAAKQDDKSKMRSETTDYASDATSLLYSEVSSTRESSPHKFTGGQQEYHQTRNIPVRVESVPRSDGHQSQWSQPAVNPQQITGFSNGTSGRVSNSNAIYGTTVRHEVNADMDLARSNHQSSSYGQTSLTRQNSDLSFDRMRPGWNRRRLRYDSGDSDSNAGVTTDLFRQRTLGVSNTSLESAGTLMWGGSSQAGSRPITPAFPSSGPPTPLLGQRGMAFNGYASQHGSRATSPGASKCRLTLINYRHTTTNPP